MPRPTLKDSGTSATLSRLKVGVLALLITTPTPKLAGAGVTAVAAAGSVYVEPYRSIERYSHVMHIGSGVQGELDAGKDAFDLFAAAFPAV